MEQVTSIVPDEPNRMNGRLTANEKQIEILLKVAPDSQKTSEIVKWSLQEDRYNIKKKTFSGALEGRLTRDDVVQACKALNEVKGMESPVYNRRDILSVLVIFGVLVMFIIAGIAVPLGQPYIYASYFFIGAIVLTCVVYGFYYFFIKQSYLEQREIAFKIVANKLNTHKFERKGFEMIIGKLGAWIEFNTLNHMEMKEKAKERTVLESITFQNPQPLTQPQQFVRKVIQVQQPHPHGLQQQQQQLQTRLPVAHNPQSYIVEAPPTVRQTYQTQRATKYGVENQQPGIKIIEGNQKKQYMTNQMPNKRLNYSYELDDKENNQNIINISSLDQKFAQIAASKDLNMQKPELKQVASYDSDENSQPFYSPQTTQRNFRVVGGQQQPQYLR